MRFKTLLVVPFLLASMGPLLAHAQSGTISFQGAIVVPTQSLTPDGIPTNEVVPHRQTDRPLSSLVDDLRTPMKSARPWRITSSSARPRVRTSSTRNWNTSKPHGTFSFRPRALVVLGPFAVVV